MNRSSTVSRSSRVDFKSYTAFTQSKLELLKSILAKPESGEHYIIQTTLEIFEEELASFEFYLDEEINRRGSKLSKNGLEDVESLNIFISSLVIDRTQGSAKRDEPRWHIIYNRLRPGLSKDTDIFMYYKEKIFGWRCLRNLYKTLIDIPTQNTFVCGVLQPSAMGMKSLFRHLLEWLLWRETQRLNGGILFRDDIDYIDILAKSFTMDFRERSLYTTPSEEFVVSDEEITVEPDEKVKGLLKPFDDGRRNFDETKTITIADPSKSEIKVEVNHSCKCSTKETRGVQATESIIDADIMISRIVIRPNFDDDKPAGLVSENYRRASIRRSVQSTGPMDDDSMDSLDSNILGLNSRRITKPPRLSKVFRNDDNFDIVEGGILIITDSSNLDMWKKALEDTMSCEIYNAENADTWSITKINEVDIILSTYQSLIQSIETSNIFFTVAWFRVFVDDEDLLQMTNEYELICSLNYYAGYVLVSANPIRISLDHLHKCFKFLHWPAWNFEDMWYMYKTADEQLSQEIKNALAPIFFSFEYRHSFSL